MSNQRPRQKDDPLNAATTRTVGRPKQKKKTMTRRGTGSGIGLP